MHPQSVIYLCIYLLIYSFLSVAGLPAQAYLAHPASWMLLIRADLGE